MARHKHTESQEEQQMSRRQQGRIDREEEPRMRCAVIRKNVSRQRGYV